MLSRLSPLLRAAPLPTPSSMAARVLSRVLPSIASLPSKLSSPPPPPRRRFYAPASYSGAVSISGRKVFVSENRSSLARFGGRNGGAVVAAGRREFRKVRNRRVGAAKKSREKELELSVKICLEEQLPEDPEIMDTLKASPPENQVMKKANIVAASTTTAFYMMCGCFGYAAFGNDAPGNLLTGFGSTSPSGIRATYLFYSVVESWAMRKWLGSVLVTGEYTITIDKRQRLVFSLNFFRLVWRSCFVIFATFVALLMPFFNDVLALLGAIGYWPLTVYFPIQMYIANNRIGMWTRRWLGLQLINSVCLFVAVAAACGSIQGLTKSLETFEPFKVMD